MIHSASCLSVPTELVYAAVRNGKRRCMSNLHEMDKVPHDTLPLFEQRQGSLETESNITPDRIMRIARSVHAPLSGSSKRSSARISKTWVQLADCVQQVPRSLLGECPVISENKSIGRWKSRPLELPTLFREELFCMLAILSRREGSCKHQISLPTPPAVDDVGGLDFWVSVLTSARATGHTRAEEYALAVLDNLLPHWSPVLSIMLGLRFDQPEWEFEGLQRVAQAAAPLEMAESSLLCDSEYVHKISRLRECYIPKDGLLCRLRGSDDEFHCESHHRTFPGRECPFSRGQSDFSNGIAQIFDLWSTKTGVFRMYEYSDGFAPGEYHYRDSAVLL